MIKLIIPASSEWKLAFKVRLDASIRSVIKISYQTSEYSLVERRFSFVKYINNTIHFFDVNEYSVYSLNNIIGYKTDETYIYIYTKLGEYKAILTISDSNSEIPYTSELGNNNRYVTPPLEEELIFPSIVNGKIKFENNYPYINRNGTFFALPFVKFGNDSDVFWRASDGDYYFDSNTNTPFFKRANFWLRTNGTSKTFPIVGQTSERKNNMDIGPIPTGTRFYNTTLRMNQYWSGSRWEDVNGFAATLKKGATSERPLGIGTTDGILDPSKDIGFEYFDITLHKPIYASAIANDGTVTWVDATGTQV